MRSSRKCPAGADCRHSRGKIELRSKGLCFCLKTVTTFVFVWFFYPRFIPPVTNVLPATAYLPICSRFWAVVFVLRLVGLWRFFSYCSAFSAFHGTALPKWSFFREGRRPGPPLNKFRDYMLFFSIFLAGKNTHTVSYVSTPPPPPSPLFPCLPLLSPFLS